MGIWGGSKCTLLPRYVCGGLDFTLGEAKASRCMFLAQSCKIWDGLARTLPRRTKAMHNIWDMSRTRRVLNQAWRKDVFNPWNAHETCHRGTLPWHFILWAFASNVTHYWKKHLNCFSADRCADRGFTSYFFSYFFYVVWVLSAVLAVSLARWVCLLTAG